MSIQKIPLGEMSYMAKEHHRYDNVALCKGPDGSFVHCY